MSGRISDRLMAIAEGRVAKKLSPEQRKKGIEKAVAAMDVPGPGWKKSVHPSAWATVVQGNVRAGHEYNSEVTTVVFEGPDDIILVAHVTAGNKIGVDGTTHYKGAKWWSNFDRFGVESSFYVDDINDWPMVAKEQIERVAKAREISKRAADEKWPTMTPVPIQASPEKVDYIKKMLKERKVWSWQPSGFGTGYRFWVNKPKREFRVLLVPKETAEVLGFKTLWYTEFEAD